MSLFDAPPLTPIERALRDAASMAAWWEHRYRQTLALYEAERARCEALEGELAEMRRGLDWHDGKGPA